MNMAGKSEKTMFNLPRSFNDFFVKTAGLAVFAFRIAKEAFLPPYEI